jgi:hypothetical protein
VDQADDQLTAALADYTSWHRAETIRRLAGHLRSADDGPDL